MLTQLAVSDIINQRNFFKPVNKNVAFLEQLRTLKQAVVEAQSTVIKALKADLNKPEFEAYAAEVGVIKEIDYAIKHIKSWTSPKKLQFRLSNFRQWMHLCRTAQVVLVLGPWNYPFHLIISPLVGAIAAGNCAILKPEIAPYTSRVVADIIKAFRPSLYCSCRRRR